MLEGPARSRALSAPGIARILRLRTTLSAPALTLIGWLDVGGHGPLLSVAIVSSTASSFALIAFSQVFNDIMDRDLDASAKPCRPLPAGLVTLREARALAIGAVVVTIAGAALTSPVTIVYSVICLMLSVLYSVRLKNTTLVGSLTVAAVSCAMLSYGSATVISPLGPELPGTVLVFLYILGNEFYKTSSDMIEDSRHGLRTIATAHGLTAAARAIALVAAALLALIAVVGVARLAPRAFLVVVSVTVAAPVLVAAAKIVRPGNVTAELMGRSHVWWRLAWLPGALSLLLLR